MRLIGSVTPDRPLLVVALPEEAAYLGDNLPILLTGVGKVCAAISLTRLLSAGVLPSEIINLGTAGALHPGMSGTHSISVVIQHDFDSAGIAALTGHTFGTPIDLLSSGPKLATGDVFVSDPALRAALATHADLVDMEGYAVAASATAFGIPAKIVKHVSDEADGNAVRNWTSSVDECAGALAEWLAVS